MLDGEGKDVALLTRALKDKKTFHRFRLDDPHVVIYTAQQKQVGVASLHIAFHARALFVLAC